MGNMSAQEVFIKIGKPSYHITATRLFMLRQFAFCHLPCKMDIEMSFSGLTILENDNDY